jgi:nucleotide-binding universal stress UspA family protein
MTAKILCPIDFSAGSRQAMRMAIRVANRSGAELVLAHVWHLPAIAYNTELAYPTGAIDAMIADERRGLEAAVHEATSLGARNASSRFLSGLPREQLVELLSDPDFELVVIGTHGRSGIPRLLLGSVAEQVVRHAPCTVLAVHEHDHGAAFKRILCPVDFSDSSQRAVDAAAELVERGHDAEITLLHIIELPVTYSGEPTVRGFVESLDHHATTLLEAWATRLRTVVPVPVVVRTRIGTPGGQTLAALHQLPAYDLVVVGSHGRTGLRRVLLGSVAEKIVRHAACPVLVARERV